MLSNSEIRQRLGPIVDPTPSPEPQSHRPSAGTIAALVLLVLLLWGGGVVLLLHLERISPTAPDPATGHVYRFTDTRHVVYFNEKERYAEYAAIGVPLLGTIGVAWLALRRRPEPED
jgi:hypothetical protein